MASVLAGCGGATKTVTRTATSSSAAAPSQGAASTVEQKFGVCIAEAAYMSASTQPDCDPTTLSASPYVPAQVTCVYKSGNEYTCQATAPSEDSQIAGKINGFWDVTYDGSNIAWQPSGP